MSIFTLLTVVMFAAKIFGFTDIAWAIVFAPMLVHAFVIIAFIVLAAILKD